MTGIWGTDNVNQADLQTLSVMRLAEAKTLLAGGNPCGAYYLAGYAVECAIKACIAKQTQQGEFPDKKRALDAFEHVLDKLITTAELRDDLNAELKASQSFFDNWNLVKFWAVESRYDNTIPFQQAANLIEAIENQQNGVLIWLQQHW